MAKKWAVVAAVLILLGTLLAVRMWLGADERSAPTREPPLAAPTPQLHRCLGDHYCLSRVSGPPGTLVSATGAAVGRNEGGIRVHDTMVQLWWELDPARPVKGLLLGSPKPRQLERATLVGQQVASAVRRFRVRFSVPRVEAGTYRVIEVLFGGGGWTTLTFRFQVR